MCQTLSGKKTWRLGLSPCPNDTYIFHALLHGLVNIEGYDGLCCLHMADVEELNRRAINGDFEITKLSVGVVPEIMENYRLLSSGAALGWGCGPLLVAKRPLEPEELLTASIGVPGKYTTANLLLDLCGKFGGPRQEMLFSDIIPAVERGDIDLGLIIHEGRFTYARHGLYKVLDMGEWWEKSFQTPLPLGAIAIRRDLPLDLAQAIQKAIGDSIAFARRQPEQSKAFIRQHAQELDEEVTNAHIRTFVTDYSMDLGPEGRAAIEKLVASAPGKKGGLRGQSLFL